jgi:DNA-directed RNA polymerase subunit RPC12/RpoP
MTLCEQFECYGTMVEKEDDLGRFLQCSRCGVKALAPGEGTSTILVAPEPVRARKTFPVSERSIPAVGGATLQKLRVRRRAREAGAAPAAPAPITKPARVIDPDEAIKKENEEMARADAIAAREALQHSYESLLMVAARLQHLVDEIKETVARSRRELTGRGSASARKQSRTYPTCSRCGRQFTGSREYTGSYKKRTPALCIDRNDCDRRLGQVGEQG